MFSNEVPSLPFYLFTLLSLFSDFRFYRRRSKEKAYNGFELYSGSYADMVFLWSLFLIGYSFFGNNINTVILLWISNLILAFVYVALFKCFLQIFILWGYSWVDTNRERAEMLLVIGNRIIIFILYALLVIFYHHIATHLYQGVSGNIVSLFVSIITSRVISHKCHSINVKLKREEQAQP